MNQLQISEVLSPKLISAPSDRFPFGKKEWNPKTNLCFSLSSCKASVWEVKTQTGAQRLW